MSKRYKVVGTQPVLGHGPGESFTAEIPTDLERFLVEIGGLRVLADVKPERVDLESPKRR